MKEVDMDTYPLSGFHHSEHGKVHLAILERKLCSNFSMTWQNLHVRASREWRDLEEQQGLQNFQALEEIKADSRQLSPE